MKGRGEAGREETTSKGEGGGKIQSMMNTVKSSFFLFHLGLGP